MGQRVHVTTVLADKAARLQERHGLGPHTALHAAALMAVHPGLVVSSGRRTPSRNRAVGGAVGSFHLVGRAVDFIGPLPVLMAAQATARNQRLGAACTGPEETFVEYPNQRRQHLHVAW